MRKIYQGILDIYKEKEEERERERER